MVASFRAAGLFVLLCCAACSAVAAAVCDGVSEVDNTDLKSVAVASGVAAPLFVTSPPGDNDRLFIVEQAGRIRLKRRGDAPAVTSLFLDISGQVLSGGEQGLLGLAFDPNYATSGEFYVNYSSGSFPCGLFGSPCEQIVSQFTVSANPDVADASSEVILMRIDEPQTNHNGGWIGFGPDDFLYIATGDGGGADDEGDMIPPGHGACGNGQNLSALLGKILRIDVLGTDPAGTPPDTTCWTGYSFGSGFTVPSDNPFADGTGGDCDEVWQYGLRNPWRNSFDSVTGDLYVADVGQNCWEEINYVAAADLSDGFPENYGWRQMEGKQCFDHVSSSNCNPASAPDCSPACNDSSLTLPVLDYPNPADGDSIIGGYVYRGCRMPNFHGTYFYGDNGSGFVRSFEISAGAVTNEVDWAAQLGRGANFLTSFGEDNRGEIYLADAGTGEVLKIMPPCTDFQVSGAGAGSLFLLNRSGNWSWEDLEFSSMHPVDYYQVYRGVPNGTFTCIHSTLDTTWVAGDLMVPSSGELLAYVVTAVCGAEETSSGDPERTLVSPCGPP